MTAKYSWLVYGYRGNQAITGESRNKGDAQHAIDSYCTEAKGYELFKNDVLIVSGKWYAPLIIFAKPRHEIPQKFQRGVAA